MGNVKIRVSYPAKWSGKKHLSENEVYEVSEESAEMYRSKGIIVTLADDKQKPQVEETEANESEKEPKLTVGTAKGAKKNQKEDEL